MTYHCHSNIGLVVCTTGAREAELSRCIASHMCDLDGDAIDLARARALNEVSEGTAGMVLADSIYAPRYMVSP